MLSRNGSVHDNEWLVLAGLPVTITLIAGAPASGCDPRRPPGITRVDYAIYSAVLKQVVPDDGWSGDPGDFDDRKPIELLVILDRQAPEVPLSFSNFTGTGIRGLEPETVAHFHSQEPGLKLDRTFQGIGAYELLSWEEIETVFGRPGGWTAFYDRFPASPGLVAFSDVGFNRERTQALVYMIHIRAGEWGNESVYFLTKAGDGWHVVNRTMLSEF